MIRFGVSWLLGLALWAAPSFGDSHPVSPEKCAELARELRSGVAPEKLVETLTVFFADSAHEDANLNERLNGAITRLKASGTSKDEAARLLSLVISKLIGSVQKLEDRWESQNNVMNLLRAVQTSAELTELLKAFRLGGSATLPHLEKMATKAMALHQERKAEEKAQEAKRFALWKPYDQTASFHWVKGDELGLPNLDNFAFTSEVKKYASPDEAPSVLHALDSLYWIQELGEHFYAIGTEQMRTLIPSLTATGSQYNADVISVSKDSEGQSVINIREFKLARADSDKALAQIKNTLDFLLRANPAIRLGKLEVLVPDIPTTLPKSSLISVQGRQFEVAFRSPPKRLLRDRPGSAGER